MYLLALHFWRPLLRPQHSINYWFPSVKFYLSFIFRQRRYLQYKKVYWDPIKLKALSISEDEVEIEFKPPGDRLFAVRCNGGTKSSGPEWRGFDDLQEWEDLHSWQGFGFKMVSVSWITIIQWKLLNVKGWH